MKEIVNVLDELKEDIVIERTSDNISKLETPKNETEVQNKMYVQQKEYFVETTKDKLVSIISNNDNQHYPFSWNHFPLQKLDTTVDIAILFQTNSHIISNLCYGLLGGISLMQLVFMYTLVKGSKNEIMSFVELYSKFAYVPTASFSILTTICLMFAFDRIDLISVIHLIKQENKTFYCNWILLFLYIVTFILSVLSFKFDEMIAMYPDTKDAISGLEDLWIWRTLNVWRCIFGIVGWFFVCISRPHDLLKHHLHSLKHNQKNSN